jgi:hypothetical protein
MRSTTKTNVIDRVSAGRIAKVLDRAMHVLPVLSLYSRRALLAPAMAVTATCAFAGGSNSTLGKRDTNPCGHERSGMCSAHRQERSWRPSQQQDQVPVASAF